MSLLQYVKNTIYQASGEEIKTPDAYERFGILIPESTSTAQGVRPFPLPDDEHLFALFWNIHDGHKLSATFLPQPYPFCYEKEFVAGTRTQLHSHEYLEFFYVMEGEYHQKILGTEYIFHSGEFCLIDKNCLHQEILDESECTIVFFGITNAMFTSISSFHTVADDIASFLHMALLEQKSLQQFLTFRPREAQFIEDMENTLLSVLQELARHDIATPLICRGLLTRAFQLLGSQYEFSLSKQQRQRMNVILSNQIIDFMKLHLNHISIQMLTKEFHFHEDYFNRLLKSQTGMTYTEYLQMLRLEKAEQLLTDTDNTIEQIAEEVGYRNKGYFYRIFVERRGCTPAQYRRKRQEKL